MPQAADAIDKFCRQALSINDATMNASRGIAPDSDLTRLGFMTRLIQSGITVSSGGIIGGLQGFGFANVMDDQFTGGVNIGLGVANASPAFQAANDSLQSGYGGIVFVPTPDVLYNLATTVTVSKGVTFIGCGLHASLIYNILGANPMFTTTSGAGGQQGFKDLQIINTVVGGVGVQWKGVDKCWMENCRIYSSVSNATLLQLDADSIAGYTHRIRFNEFQFVSGHASQKAVDLKNGVTSVLFLGNTVLADFGWIESASAVSHGSNQIIGNLFGSLTAGPTGTAIKFDSSGGAQSGGHHVAYNYFDTYTTGIDITAGTVFCDIDSETLTADNCTTLVADATQPVTAANDLPLAAYGTSMHVANTGAVTINAILIPSNARRKNSIVTLIFDGDGGTYPLVKHNTAGTPGTTSRIWLIGGTDFTATATNATLQLQFDGTYFYQLGGGVGNVVGPASATDNALVRFDGTTGKLIQDYTSNAPTVTDAGVMYVPGSLGVGVSPATIFNVLQNSGFGTWTPGYSSGGTQDVVALVQSAVTTKSTNFVVVPIVSYLNINLSGSPSTYIGLGLNALTLINSSDSATWGANSFIAGGAYAGRYEGSGSIPTVKGIQVQADRGNAGNVTTAMIGADIFSTQDNSATGGTVTALKMVNVNRPTGKAGMTFTNIYGIDIANQTPAAGTLTNTAFAIRQQGAADLCSFAGILTTTNYMQYTEMAAPGVGAANTARVYAVDNGAGKTQLMVIFQSGAAQQLAIEP